ncbi:class I SAM-dependent methyltransferase [Aureivirga sp. CE67]|uniref:class I SAM-dependent methyltransferase n=1 Tax=Aureivirga sp. CE67 TaxID=1788983 RepID=UPI0018CA8109|nr:methyltransferase domain-containing protein [Aureivirga sp. CE67]
MKFNFIQKWYLKKANVKLERLSKFYTEKEKILDVGSGNGGLCYLLKNENLEVTSLDIKNKSGFQSVSPIIYNGVNFPFEQKSFDTVQIITVLHHIPDPVNTIKEAQKTAKRIIIMEDIFESYFQKILTHIVDSIVNWEFIGHPYTNKDDKGWRDVFEDLNLEIEKVEYYKFLFFFKQVTYVLKNKA